MKTKLCVVGSIAVLALGITSAQAGPCATEIESLSKTMASTDAGSGPTSGANGAHAMSSQAGQHPPTTAMSEATHGGAASPADVRRQTAGQLTAAEQASNTGAAAVHPPTAVMNQATQGNAAPSTPGQQPPTAAMNQAVQGQTAPSNNAGKGTGSSSMEASAALDRARGFDRQGNESDCMQAVQQAKQLSGSK